MRRHGRWNKHKHVRRDSSPKRRIARAGCALCSLLGNNDAGLLTLEFGGFWKLATKEFYEAARTRAAVGAQQTHAVEKNQQIENFRVLEDGRTGALRLLFFDFGDKADQCGIEFARQWCVRGFFVDDAGAQRFVGLGKRLESGEDVGVHGSGLDSAKLGDGEGQRGHELLVSVDDILRDFFTEQRSVRGQGALMAVFVAVGGDEIRTIGRAVNGDFALGATADRADFFAFGRAEAGGFAPIADRAGHGISSSFQNNQAGYAAPPQKTKALNDGSRPDEIEMEAALEHREFRGRVVCGEDLRLDSDLSRYLAQRPVVTMCLVGLS